MEKEKVIYVDGENNLEFGIEEYDDHIKLLRYLTNNAENIHISRAPHNILCKSNS